MSSVDPRTDLDSHANMCVFGRHCLIVHKSGRHAEVTGFSSDLKTLHQVPIVDAAICYDCPYTMKSYVLLARNVLYVPSMTHNLIPPFILREAGIQVNDVPKIHVADPTVEDHSIYFKDFDLRIPLSLWGIFSYFSSRRPVDADVDNTETIIITPDGPSWNPHSDVYARNEENMLDWRGDMVEKRYRRRVLFDDDDDAMDIAAACIESTDALIRQSELTREENWCINSVYDHAVIMDTTVQDPINSLIPAPCDEVYPVLANISSTLDPSLFASNAMERLAVSMFGMSIGSMTVSNSSDLFVPEVQAAHARAPKGVTAQQLSKLWRIDHATAQRTLAVTSQLKKHDGDSSFSRNYSTNDRMLRYKRIKDYFFTDTFFVTGKAKSTRGNTCMQLFVSDKGFVHVVPMRSRGQFLQALKSFAKEIGVPEALIVDPSGEQTSNKVRQFCHQISTTLRSLEEGTQWANRAELYIGLFKESVRKDLLATNSPLVLWDYCVERRARIHNLTAKDLFQLHGQNPHSITLGDEGDISNLCVHDWYGWTYYRDQKEPFPLPKEKLGRILGPSKNAGNEMSQWVLTSAGTVVPRRSCRPLQPHELRNDGSTHHRQRQHFDAIIKEKLGDSLKLPEKPLADPDLSPYEDDDETPPTLVDLDTDPVDSTGKPICEQPYYDKLIHAEVILPHEGDMYNAKVVGRTRDSSGHSIGTYDDNPVLNSVIYDVEFPDGVVKQYAANVIAENILSQVDSEGYQYRLLDSIVDVKSDGNAVKKGEEYVVTKRGRKRIRHTTAGWKFLVQWIGGSQQWVPLKLIKESNPVEVAEFVQSRSLTDEPAFRWWVPYTLRKRNKIIAAINSKLRANTHKYGVEVPTSVAHAHRLDKENGNTFWADAIKKEMYNVSVAFEILEDGSKPPPGWAKSSGHLVFDVKMDFTRKARWVKDGHRTPDPDWSTYAGFVTRDSVRIALTYAALNELDIIAADIKNAYLQAPASEKHYIICGAEFGLENVGKVALIRRALYGGKSAGRDFWNHLRDCMNFLGFTSCKADPDVWMRQAIKSDGTPIYEYVLLYCDDTLVISERGEDILRNEIGKYFELKEESIGPPTIYLGGKLSKVTLQNGVEAWSFSSSQYVQNAVGNVEDYLKKLDRKLKAKAKAPFTGNYRPEVDTTPELDAASSSYYMSLIGILRWVVELGRVDIACEVSLMSSHMAMPREGHLDQLFNIFAYLKHHHNAEMVFDPSYPEIDPAKFERQDWSATVYGSDLVEELPHDMPKPLGLAMKMTAYVDSDHAGDCLTRRSRTGFLVYLNSALISWLSKKQTSIETSSFGSEFVAMKQCTEYVRGLRYKMRMMGIPCEEPTYIYGDNQSVLANTTRPHSVLKKKSNAIAYHFVREGCARDEWRTTYVNTHHNPADLLTKPLPAGEKRVRFVRMLLYHIYNDYKDGSGCKERQS